MLNKLAELQHQCDVVTFDLKGRSIDECDPDSVMMHKLLHLAKLLGKLATYLERRHHGAFHQKTVIETEVIPDLLVYCLQLSRLLGTDLDASYLTRLESIFSKGLADFPHRYSAVEQQRVLAEAKQLLASAEGEKE